MCPLRENARRISKGMTMAAVAMAETMEIRVARLESDVAHIRSDVADLKVDVREMRKDIGGVHEKIGGLRDEMRKDIGGVHEKIGGLRDEMRKDIGGLRGEMREKFDTLGRSNLQTRIWMLLIGGAILGVLAHAVHWL
jgi:septation ring formation regulator EzrA